MSHFIKNNGLGYVKANLCINYYINFQYFLFYLLLKNLKNLEIVFICPVSNSSMILALNNMKKNF